MYKHLMLAAAALALSACGNANQSVQSEEAIKAPVKIAERLDAVLAAQPEKNKARYAARNPKETLLFLGIEPGMRVAEALPGNGGYYSQILLPYLGEGGHLTGMDYNIEMWPEFGGFATPEFVEKKKTWPADWTAIASEWNAAGAGLDATTFGKVSADMAGKYDVVLFIRAMHNVSRFESKGGYMTQALGDANMLLKSGGILGVVQHQGPEANSDEWATGSNGYLKKSTVKKQIEAAGFEFVAESAINENPKDIPNNEEIVWRLPPSLGSTEEGTDERAAMVAIGESNRMTLLFKKK